VIQNRTEGQVQTAKDAKIFREERCGVEDKDLETERESKKQRIKRNNKRKNAETNKEKGRKNMKMLEEKNIIERKGKGR
jgi:hypothetical protein